jgi:hypothetical protein
MDNHAQSVLADAECWQWMVARRILKTKKQGGHYEAIILKLLSWLIKESQRFGGTILDQFWEHVRECHLKLKESGVSKLFWSDILVKLTCPVDNLSRNPLAVPSNQSSMVLFQGAAIDRNDVDFTPVFDMAAEYFTHLGIACKCPTIPTLRRLHTTVAMNPGGLKSGNGGTPHWHSVSDIVNIETDELLAVASSKCS